MKKLLATVLAAGLLACGPAQTSNITSGGERGGAIADKTGSSATAASGPSSFRAKQPAPGTPRPFQLPSVQTFKLGEAIDVYLVEDHSLPTVSVSLVFDGGAMTDPAGKEGLASVCMDMLTEGTRRLDKLAFQRKLADIGSDVWSWASVDTQGLGMRTLSKNFEGTLKLFRQSLRAPGFRGADLKRMVKRRIQSIKQAKGNPGSVAGRLLWSVTFGPKHPRGRISTENSLRKIRVADCRRYQRAYLKPRGARLFVVGDLTKEQVETSFSKLLKGWKGKPKLPTMPARAPRDGRIFFVNIPGAAQSSVYLTHSGPERKDPQYFANWMMAQVFGGSFSARVNMNLREDKGYSYGARGGFSYNRMFGTFYAGASVRSDSTIQSIRELYKEMKDLRDWKRKATTSELTREKNGAILALPARFATAKQALSQYRNLVYFGLSLDYYNTFVSKVNKVGLDQVNMAARAQLQPGNVQLLVVGDGKAAMKVRENGKDVPMVDRDGKPITLLVALKMMAAEKEMGAGGLVILDADGKIENNSK
ncbi:MAG: insulinase family protein [Deltaproteobacteria bacterium]|nr:insulinase family protein [Deltaproteobacteria bacterium]